MRYDFKFGQYWLSELGARSSEPPSLEIAQRDVTFVTIPGKDGDDCIDNGSYSNVEIKRKIAVLTKPDADVGTKVQRLINSFAYLQGYREFEDTDHIGFVTEAALKNFNTIQRKLRTLNTAELSFTRKPFWYLKSGLDELPLDMAKLLGSGVELYNPFPAEAKPIYRFDLTFPSTAQTTTYDCTVPFAVAANYGGVYSEKSNTMTGITITATSHFLVIDTEKQQITVQDVNGTIYKYIDKPIPAPVGSGKIVVRITNQYTQIAAMSIIPRWRRL